MNVSSTSEIIHTQSKIMIGKDGLYKKKLGRSGPRTIKKN
jgi:hypothetical protein